MQHSTSLLHQVNKDAALCFLQMFQFFDCYVKNNENETPELSRL